MMKNLLTSCVGLFLISLLLTGVANGRDIVEKDILEYFEDPIFNDLWFGIYDQNDQKYGWWHTEEYREGDYWVFEDKSEIKLLDRVQVDRRFYDDQTVIRNHSKEYYRIGDGFLLSRVEDRYEHNDEIRITTATITDGNVRVDVNNDGINFSYNVQGFSLRFDEVYRVELLLRKYKNWSVGDTIEYKYYDLETFEISSETDILRGIDETFRDGVPLKYYQVDTVQSDARHSFKTVLSGDGTPLKYSEIGGHTDLESEEQAKSDIGFGGFTFEDAIVSVDRTIPPLARVSKITLEIVGTYDGGIRSGHQQKVYSEDGKNFLVLGKKIGSRELGLPEDRKENLQESSLYPIEDAAIREMVQRVVGPVTDEWQKVKVLLDHVGRYIVDDYTSNSMSTFEILKKRKGDCSEHTLLFNTLARAAGIPTREVRGLLNYEERKFGLHAWNEVLIDGKWHGVDATWGHMATPITHIQFQRNNYIPSSYDFHVIDVEYVDPE